MPRGALPRWSGGRSAPAAGQVHVGGAKNSALKLMAAALLAPRADHAAPTCPDILDIDDHGRGAAPARLHGGARAHAGPAAERQVVDRRARRSSATRPTTTWSAGCAPRSACSARCWPAAARPGWRCPAATPSARAAWTCTSPAWPAGRRDRQRARLRRRRGARRPDRRADLAGLPERRRHREPADGGGAAPRAPRSSTTPPASRRSSTSARCSSRWAPRSTGVGTSTLDRSRASTGCTRSSTRPSATGSWPAPGRSPRR